MKSTRLAVLCIVTALLLPACATRNPVIDQSGETYDGMVPVRDSGIQDAWVKPDIDISSYRQILLLPVALEFRATRPIAGTTLSRPDVDEFPVSPRDRERLATTVTDIFRDELAKSRNLTLTNGPGPDVLAVKTSLLDIVSRVPPEVAGRSEIYLDKVGEATLVLELQDSVSGEILARAVDRRAADPVSGGPNDVTRVTSVTAWSEVRRVARRWATTVTTRIDQLYTRGKMAAGTR